MREFELEFGQPLYLLLLGLLPAFWWLANNPLLGTKSIQWYVSFILRVAVLLFLVAALSDVHWVRHHDETDVFFVLDQSDSLTPDQRGAAFQFAKSLQRKFQDDGRANRTGIVVFGRNAEIEQPLSKDNVTHHGLEILLDQSGSNLAAGIRLAAAAFDGSGGRRIVLVSDGNENLGDVLSQSKRLGQDGIAFDVAVVPQRDDQDIAIDRVQSPNVARQGAPFEVTSVIHFRKSSIEEASSRASGKLVLVRRSGNESTTIAEEKIVLQPGINYYRFKDELENAAFYSYIATFFPDSDVPDAFPQNNEASGVTQIATGGRVLLIAGNDRTEIYSNFVEVLRENQIETVVRGDSTPFFGLEDLQNFDSVILADVPRVVTGSEFAEVRFQDHQIQMLVTNLEKLGCGLLMIGGPNSFGAGGWSNTLLEKAMPVDFQVLNPKLVSVGALALVIDKSGSMQGEKMTMAISAAQAALSMLSDKDYVGVYTFDSDLGTVIPIQPIGDRRGIIKRQIGRLSPGGGTNMEPALSKAYRDIERSAASLKHVIVLTDGLTTGSGYVELATKLRGKGVTTSTISIGQDAAKTLLSAIAKTGGGKFYQPNSPHVLPKIFMKEARVVSRPLLFEDLNGIDVRVQAMTGLLTGIDEQWPPITGYVLTTLKDSPLVETALIADRPEAPNNAILSGWQFGLGRSIVWTTDGGERWAKNWAANPNFKQLVLQVVRWSMRPTQEFENFHLATEIKDGQLKILVNAIAKDGKLLNGLDLRGDMIGLVSQLSKPLKFSQVAPGRYSAEMSLSESGDYLFSIVPQNGRDILRSGFSYRDTSEYRRIRDPMSLLGSVAGQGGNYGTSLIRSPENQAGMLKELPRDTNQWGKVEWPNVYRQSPTVSATSQPVWPLCVLLASVAFLLDVANRKINIVSIFARFGLGQNQDVKVDDNRLATRMDRLHSAKQLSLETTSFGLHPSDRQPMHPTKVDNSKRKSPESETHSEPDSGEPSYTHRLLAAKRKAKSMK